MTATLLPGRQTNRACNFVDLQDHHHTVQRYNRRPEIQLRFRILSHGIENWEFSDLRWVVIDDVRQKVIIFCAGMIWDGFPRIFYLWKQLSYLVAIRHERLRTYNVFNWPDYNIKTRELVWKPDRC